MRILGCVWVFWGGFPFVLGVLVLFICLWLNSGAWRFWGLGGLCCFGVLAVRGLFGFVLNFILAVLDLLLFYLGFALATCSWAWQGVVVCFFFYLDFSGYVFRFLFVLVWLLGVLCCVLRGLWFGFRCWFVGLLFAGCW